MDATQTALLVTAVAGLLSAAAAWLRSRTNQKIDDNTASIREVHLLVNNRLTQSLDRIEQLVEALGGSGVTIPPPRQAVIPPDPITAADVEQYPGPSDPLR